MITDLMFGGITGLIGGIAEKVTAYKIKKLEIELKKEEWAARTKITTIEADALVASEDSKALAASYQLEPKRFGIKWLDALRGSIRPLLTLYLCGVTTIMYVRTDGAMIEPQAVVDTILYLTVTACTWWFGSRGMKSK